MSKKPSVREEKGVYILELDASGDMSQTFHTLEVKRPIVALQESFETLMSPEFYIRINLVKKPGSPLIFNCLVCKGIRGVSMCVPTGKRFMGQTL